MKIKIVNMTTEKSLTIGDTTDDFILVSKDFGSAPSEHSTTKYINLIGSHVDCTSIGDRAVQIVGTIIAKNAGIMKERKTELNRLINPQNFIRIYCNAYYMTVRPASTVKYSVDKYENTSTYCKFLIEATAYEPVFKRINEEVFYYSTANKVPLFPLIIPKIRGICFGKFSAVTAKNILNDGDIETGFTAKFIADEGEAVNPKIVNNKTGKSIEIIISMQKGDIVELSTVSGNKYVKFIRGSTETDIFKLVTKKSTMSMTLNTGVNDISITAARNAANLNNVIRFTPLYLEVQE